MPCFTTYPRNKQSYLNAYTKDTLPILYFLFSDHFCGFVRPEGGEMVEPANTSEEKLKNNEEEGAKGTL